MRKFVFDLSQERNYNETAEGAAGDNEEDI